MQLKGRIIQGILKPEPEKVSVLLQKMRDLKEEQDQHLQRMELLRRRVKVVQNEMRCIQSRIELAAETK